ncbi:hypothetical protein GF391_04135 [Candidatus Uhrbacteria bacterium]|nr:hypothetical protein [Candidatus Uhrbacteria bacterium]
MSDNSKNSEHRTRNIDSKKSKFQVPSLPTEASAKEGSKFLSGNIVALALILTSAILITAIGVGIVVMQGARQSRTMDDAVAAYYLANSGIELQLFGIRKDSRTLADMGNASNTYPGGTSWESTTGLEQTGVKRISYLPEEELAFVDLFNPDDISEASNAAKVSVTWTAGDDCGMETPEIEAAYAEWEFSGGSVTWPSDENYTIWPFTPSPMDIAPLDVNKSYRLRLRPFNCSVKDLQITMYDVGGNQLDYPGDIVLGSEGTYEGTTQKLSVSMPRQDVLSGIFSYIIFSQQQLCKKVGLAGTCP